MRSLFLFIVYFSQQETRMLIRSTSGILRSVLSQRRLFSSSQVHDVYIYNSASKSVEKFEPKYPRTIFWSVEKSTFGPHLSSLDLDLLLTGTHVAQRYTIVLTSAMQAPT